MSLRLSLLPHGLGQPQLRHVDETWKLVLYFPYLLPSIYLPFSVFFTTAATCCCLCMCFLPLCTVQCTAWLSTPSSLLTCIRTVTFHSTLHQLLYSRPVRNMRCTEAPTTHVDSLLLSTVLPYVATCWVCVTVYSLRMAGPEPKHAALFVFWQ